MVKVEMLGRDEVFRCVFEELRVPWLAVDLIDLLEFVAHPNADVGASYSIRLDVPRSDRRGALIGAWRGLIKSLEVPNDVVELFKRSVVFEAAPALKDRLSALTVPGVKWSITESEEHLQWDEVSPWPAGYRMFLDHLSKLIWGYAKMLDNRVKELGGGAILDQASRIQPTRQHYAAASLGAWLGGATSLQYFSFYATDPQCRKPDKNREYAQRMGYKAADAEALTRSGLIAVPASLAAPLLNAQGDGTIFGSLPIDEWSLVNPPHVQKVLVDRKLRRHPGLLVDKYYRTPYFARPLKNRGLLGKSDILRDHYEQFYRSHGTNELLRCKHYCAPIIEVRSREQLEALISEIPLRAKAMHFRGQTRLHELQREKRVRALLFSKSTAREPSLITSAARNMFDYDSLHFALRYFIQDRTLGAVHDPVKSTVLHAEWREESMKVNSPIDYAIMALAQHYGLPSHGLDVTDEVDVAIWFATHRLRTIDGISSYVKIDTGEWSTDTKTWPVIFVLQQVTQSLNMSTQSCVDLNMFRAPRTSTAAPEGIFLSRRSFRPSEQTRRSCSLRLQASAR